MGVTESFAVALTCIDGRIHDALRDWIHHRFDVDAIDLVTVQGPDNVLANEDDAWVDRLAERVRVSQRAHGSTQLILASHSDCAGHPVPDAEHRRDVDREATRLRPILPGMHVTVVHIGQDGVRWTPVEVRAGASSEAANP